MRSTSPSARTSASTRPRVQASSSSTSRSVFSTAARARSPVCWSRAATTQGSAGLRSGSAPTSSPPPTKPSTNPSRICFLSPALPDTSEAGSQILPCALHGGGGAKRRREAAPRAKFPLRHPRAKTRGPSRTRGLDQPVWVAGSSPAMTEPRAQRRSDEPGPHIAAVSFDGHFGLRCPSGGNVLAGARAAASVSLTIGVAFVTLLVAGGILAGPAILDCSHQSGGIGACLRAKEQDAGLLPDVPSSSSAPAVSLQT